jgi:hypothetical protein
MKQSSEVRVRLFQQDPRILVFLKTPVTDNNDFVAFKKILKLVLHLDDGVFLEIILYKVSNKVIRFRIETAGFGGSSLE